MTSPCNSAVTQKVALVVPSGGEVDELLISVLASESWSIQPRATDGIIKWWRYWAWKGPTKSPFANAGTIL
jgi:hypothetical protein